MQWASGNAKTTENGGSFLDEFIAINNKPWTAAVKTYYSMFTKNGLTDAKVSTTEEGLRDFFKSGGVIHTRVPATRANTSGHYITIVGIAEGKNGKIWVHVVDSTCYSGVYRFNDKGYATYNFKTGEKQKSGYNGGGEYWIDFNTYKNFCTGHYHIKPTITPITRSYYKTNKNTFLYNTPSVTSNKLSINQGIGIIIIGKLTANNILWYKSADGYFVNANDVYYIENAPEIGGYKEVSPITIKAKETKWKTSANLKDEPYADAKNMDKVYYNKEFTVKGLYINKYNNYWVGVEKDGRKFYICVDSISRSDADNSNNDVVINNKSYAPKFNVTDGSLFPNGNRKKGAGFELRGTISSPYTIKNAQGFVLTGSLLTVVKTEKQSKKAIINNTSFDLQKSCVNVAKNGGIAFGTISEGYKLFRLDICYVKNVWHDVTNCKDNPLKQQEFTRKFYSLFTVGTKYNNSNNPLGALMVASVAAEDPTESMSDVEPVTLSADISVKPSKIEYKGLKYKIDYQSKTATFLGCKDKKADSIVIPSTVENDGETFKVTTVAKEACKDMPNLEKLTIGKNIEAIGEEAFRDCKNLRKIIIKTTKLTSKNVGKKAFKGIDKKATISCPDTELQNYKEFLVKKGIPKAAFE